MIEYGGYVKGKPGTVVTTLRKDGATPSDSEVVLSTLSSTTSTYDPAGNLEFSFNAEGEGTEYEYADGLPADDPNANAPGVPKGFLLRTWRVRNPADPEHLSATPDAETVYYTAGDVAAGVAGVAAGRPKYTADADGNQTWYAYDTAGDAVQQYRRWVDPAGGPARWVGTSTDYDDAGRVVETRDVTYADGGPGGVPDGALAFRLDYAVPPGEPPRVVVDDLPGSAAPEAVLRGPVTTAVTTYNALGQVGSTEDAYTAADPAVYATVNTYDARGNLVRTRYADGTETRTAYDDMGRAVWAMERFKPASPTNSNSPGDLAVVTHTLYDGLGRAYRTERYRDAAVFVGAETLPGVDAAGDPAPVSVATATLGVAGTKFASTETAFDAAGRTVGTETLSHPAAGPAVVTARAGSAYYPAARTTRTAG